MTNEHQYFDQQIRKSQLNGGQRHEAWRLFKEQGIDAALQYVETVALSAPPPIHLRERALFYPVWGREHIDHASLEQMDGAMRLPVALAGALMPDAHKGYGLPIGGVLATENVVIPYAVGVDIACRMMLTVYPVAPDVLDKPESPEYDLLRRALQENTSFGAGGAGLHDGQIEHPILDESNWEATGLLRNLRKTTIYQIGTSGTGNHFVEWGAATITATDNPLGLKPGDYLALLSHSGSRGVGYKIAEFYSALAMTGQPNLPDAVKHLAWLAFDAEAGAEYWHAMHLAGAFASANHHIIHECVARTAGLTPAAAVKNHHNFAWKETVMLDGRPREAIVHRKGATPAGSGVLGVIPGTMADRGYIVLGKGKPESLSSASHGGGRTMSRTQAKKTISPQEQGTYLAAHGVTLIGGGLDEAPQAYKRIEDVINAQSDLVEIMGTFQPRLVRMAADTPPYQKKAVPTGIVDAEGD